MAGTSTGVYEFHSVIRVLEAIMFKLCGLQPLMRCCKWHEKIRTSEHDECAMAITEVGCIVGHICTNKNMLFLAHGTASHAQSPFINLTSLSPAMFKWLWCLFHLFCCTTRYIFEPLPNFSTFEC